MFSSKFSQRFFTRNLTGPWNFIAGERCIPQEPIGLMKVIEPATGKILCELQNSGPKDVDSAVNAARNAFKSWSALSVRDRGGILRKASHTIRDNVEEIAKLEVKDTGKPIWEARVDILSCADALEYFAGIAPAVTGQHVPLAGGSFALVSREPHGVVVGIGAWNFPLQTCVWKAAPALVCGNTFIFKPSQFTPVTATLLGEIFSESGVPPGVYNVVQGEGETGSLLCKHAGVQKVSFTGSVPTGIKIMQSGAESIKAVTLELGGKSPLIVFDDADLVNAVKAALMANFLSQGEVCSNGTRVYVHKKIMAEFTKKLVEQTKKMVIGNPFRDDVTVGATIHEDHAKKVLGYIERAKQQGANVLCGGERVEQKGELEGGWYLSPCVLSNVTDDMQIAREEVFGAVLSLLEFENEEEVVERANDSQFGLAGAVFTRDIQRGHRVAKNIESGMVWINTYNLYPPEVPFGGFKMSGIGREGGTWAIDAFSQSKTVYVEMGDVDCGPLYSE